MTTWKTAQVCMAGHLINSDAQDDHDKNETCCSKCGQPTITACMGCKEPIRGRCYDTASRTHYDPRRVPSFCHACGKPYPWTERKTSAVAEMIDELDGLNDEEKAKLKKSIPDIVAETPNSEAAILRFKKAVAKVGQVGGKLLTEILSKVAAEAVKKSLGL